MKKQIDLIIPYVNSADKEWQKDFIATCESSSIKQTISPERWRDLGTFKYLFRGVSEYMPWIRKIHLVVERESQVPEWINRKKVNIVYHRDIIPSWYLPTYNSTCIEMFIYKIPGLSDHFLYGNDDIFPLQPMEPGDFFDENMNPKISVVMSPVDVMGVYTLMMHNGENFVRRMLQKGPADITKVMRLGHSINPMCKATWEKFWEFDADAIKNSLTAFRDSRNFNQDMHQYYHYLSDNYSQSNRRTRYTNLLHLDKIIDTLNNKWHQLLCMNDIDIKDIDNISIILCHELQRKFPNKCKYEK